MTRHLLRNSVMTDLMPHRRLSARSASSYAVIFTGTRVPRQLLSASWVLCFFLSSRRRHGLWMEGACCVGCVHENHQDFTRWRHIHRGRNITFQIGAQKPQKKSVVFFRASLINARAMRPVVKKKNLSIPPNAEKKKKINPSGEMRDRLLLSNDVETTFCTRPIASIEIDHRVSSQLRGLLYQTHSLAGRSRSVARSVCSAFSAPNICSSRARLLSCA